MEVAGEPSYLHRSRVEFLSVHLRVGIRVACREGLGGGLDSRGNLQQPWLLGVARIETWVEIAHKARPEPAGQLLFLRPYSKCWRKIFVDVAEQRRTLSDLEEPQYPHYCFRSSKTGVLILVPWD